MEHCSSEALALHLAEKSTDEQGLGTLVRVSGLLQVLLSSTAPPGPQLCAALREKPGWTSCVLALALLLRDSNLPFGLSWNGKVNVYCIAKPWKKKFLILLI